MRQGVCAVAFLAVAAWPQQARAQTAGPVVFEPLEGTVLRIGGAGRFRGSIEVRADGGGLTVVNELGLEDYLLGVDEVPASWPMEALKAQAVAARTYALWSMERRSSARVHDVCATTLCQRYRGASAEHPRWVHAVRATRGEVLLYEGKPALSAYSARGSSVHRRNFPDAGSLPYLAGSSIVGMNQNGARLRAERGDGYTQILAEYYGGLRPTRTTRASSLRVGLLDGIPELRLSGDGPFAVTSGGERTAAWSVGTWTLRPDGGRVAAVQPEGSELPLGLFGIAHRTQVAPDGTVPVEFVLLRPAEVSARLLRNGAEVATAHGVFGTGPQAVRFDGVRSGRYELVLEAVSGDERKRRTVTLDVARPPRTWPSAAAGLAFLGSVLAASFSSARGGPPTGTPRRDAPEASTPPAAPAPTDAERPTAPTTPEASAPERSEPPSGTPRPRPRAPRRPASAAGKHTRTGGKAAPRARRPIPSAKRRSRAAKRPA